ncbi:MAG: lysophospholipid acyltransferase family protein [Cyanobacteria bacterium P01_F01_bin.42]
MSAPFRDNIGLPSRVSPRVTSLLYPFGSRVLLPLYFDKIQIEGQEHLPQSGPLLIAPTHRSRWDGLVIGHCFGRPATGRDPRYMVSVNEMRGVQGWVIRQFGGFAVDPDAPAVTVLRHGIDLLLRDQAVVIFGEGDIFYERQVNYIKPGLARIALQAQKRAVRRRHHSPIRILPVGLYYSESQPTKGSSVDVRFGPTLNVEDYLSASSKCAAAKLTADLKRSLNVLMTKDSPMSLVPAQAL